MTGLEARPLPQNGEIGEKVRRKGLKPDQVPARRGRQRRQRRGLIRVTQSDAAGARRPYIEGMDKLGLVLRTVVFFLFPVPFLLSFAVSQGGSWTAYLAYVAIAALVATASVLGWATSRRGGEP